MVAEKAAELMLATRARIEPRTLRQEPRQEPRAMNRTALHARREARSRTGGTTCRGPRCPRSSCRARSTWRSSARATRGCTRRCRRRAAAAARWCSTPRTAGWGCSTRNGGQISTSVKPGSRSSRAGTGRRTRAPHPSGRAAFARVDRASSSRAEGIDCDFRVVGRFHAAHNAAQYEALATRSPASPRDSQCRPRSCRARSSARDRHRCLFWRRRLSRARLARSGALSPRPARARASRPAPSRDRRIAR